jgi:hypothetical protein
LRKTYLNRAGPWTSGPDLYCGGSNRLLCLLDHIAKALVAVEDDQRRLRVSPGHVSLELVDGGGEGGHTLPDFAFGDEDVGTALPDDDVRLSLAIEGLAGCFSLVLPVELYQEVEAQGFLAQVHEGFGAVFHDQRHVLHNGEDVLVDFLGKIELLLGGELEIEWLGSDLLTDREDG